MATRYEPDYEGIGRLMRSDEMVQLVAATGQRALEYAEEISPVRTGRYRAGWRMETSSAGGPSHDRAEARVINDAVDEVLADVVDGYDVPSRLLSYLGDEK